MSCGNPHATPCEEVDAHLDEYLDKELSPDAKACGCSAPSELRSRVMRRITEIRTGGVQITVEETRIYPE